MSRRCACAVLSSVLLTLPSLLHGSWCAAAALAPSVEALVKPKVSKALLQLLKSDGVVDLAEVCEFEVATDGETRFPPLRLPDIIVHLREGSASLQAAKLVPEPTLPAARLVYANRDTRLGFVVVRFESQSGGALPDQFAAVIRLALHADVRRVEPNCSYQDARRGDDRAARANQVALRAPARPVSGPDPYFRQQWGLKLLPAPDVWRLAGRTRPLVAVLDTGVDCSNPELQGQLRVSGTSINWPSTAHGPCPPGVGRDFVVNPIDDDPSPCGPSGRCEYHGTSMAAIIAAKTGNALGIAAVAPKAKLLIVRTSNEWDEPASIENRSFAIVYAVDEGATILNISQHWRIWSSDAIQSALTYARKTLVNVAAGNYRMALDVDPLSSFPNVTWAMALHDPSTLWSGSNSACWERRAILAPGYDIHAALVSDNIAMELGTSPATAFVSGAHALLWSMPAHRNDSAFRIHEFLFDSTPRASFSIQGATGSCRAQLLCLASLVGKQCP